MAMLFFCIHFGSYFVYEYVYMLIKGALIKGVLIIGVLTGCAIVPAGKMSG